ncbi:MAG: hypothetical protein M0R46_14200 [Candidatus Muirbacterium halophilum]|nr:hypothetical protein [Candidatus Muirbacterium halophilum]
MKKQDIDRICKEYNIINYIINEDDSIDVEGDVDLSGKKLKTLPLKFRNVSGNFDCSNNKLVSLEGAPERVFGNFNCSNNKLTNLQFIPKTYYSSCVNISTNMIRNLEYLHSSYKKLIFYNTPIYILLTQLINYNIFINIINKNDRELIREFVDREIIQQDKLLVNRLVEFLYDIDKPKTKEELIELLKDEYEIR